jgi:hypothetical protein
VLLTYKLGVTTEVLTSVRDALGSGRAMAAVAAGLSEQHMARYMKRRTEYAHMHASLWAGGQQQLSASGGVLGVGALPAQFGDFDDRERYSGKAPTAAYLVRNALRRVLLLPACSCLTVAMPHMCHPQTAVVLADSERLAPYYKTRLMMITGDVLKGDHTFKMAGKVHADGGRPYEAVYTLMNEFNQVLGSWLLRSKEHALVRALHRAACVALCQLRYARVLADAWCTPAHLMSTSLLPFALRSSRSCRTSRSATRSGTTSLRRSC